MSLMKTLKTKDKVYDLDEIEAKTIIGYLTSKGRATHFEFRGQALKASECSVANSESSFNEQEKQIYEYSTPELHAMLGNFISEYEKHDIGEMIAHKAHGSIRQGILDWKISLGVITNRGVIYPEIMAFQKKMDAMCQIMSRRSKARRLGKPLPDESLEQSENQRQLNDFESMSVS